jgi:Wax ester synthase-like Acyl-CoA acyltransferase domain
MTAVATAAAERMSALDAEFFAEHANVPLHIGSVAVLDGPPPSREDLMRLFEAKLPRVPRYRQVVRAAPFQLARPVWAEWLLTGWPGSRSAPRPRSGLRSYWSRA